MTSAPEMPPAPPLMQPAGKPKRRTLKIVLIIVAGFITLLAALIVGVVLLVSNSTADAQVVSDKLVAAVQQGDGAAAYALTGPAFRAASTEEQLTELVQNVSAAVTKAKRSPDGKGISVSSGSGKIAVFTYTLEGADGSPLYIKTQIRDEDGTWQVLSFQSSRTPLTTDVE